jgi:hypothetical protein
MAEISKPLRMRSFPEESQALFMPLFTGVRGMDILGNSDAASKGIHGAAEKEPGCVIT